MGEYDDIIMRSLNWAENLRRQQMGMPSTDVENLSNRQYYGTWGGYGISTPRGELNLERVPGVSILADRRPELSGLKNVDYTNGQMIKMGEDWKKDQLGASSRTPWGTIAPAALDFIGSAYNGFKYDKTASDLSADYGYGRSQALGVGYTTQNIADARQVMKEEHSGNVTNTLNTMGKGAAVGAMAGSIIPGLGTAVGGIIGGAVGGIAGLIGGGHRHSEARKQLALQQQQAIRTNEYNRSLAMTAGIQQDFAKKYGNQESQVLFAAGGKDEEGGTPAVVQPFETKDSDGKLTTYFGGKLGKDSIMDYVKDGDTIFSLKTPVGQAMTQLSMKINKNKGKNLDLANRVARSTVEAAKEEQKMYRAAGLLPEEKVAHAAYGIDGWGNVLQGIAGIGTAIGGFLQAKNSRVHKPDIRVNNPYEVRALNDLYSLRPDNLAINRQLREAEARGRYQIANSGGLSAGQRALANIAMTANTQDNISNALAQSQDRFNALRGNAATAALNAGNAAAQRTQHALQYNDASYQQAASARQNIMRDYLAQIPGMLGHIYKNYYTEVMGSNMLNLYLQDIKNRKA